MHPWAPRNKKHGGRTTGTPKRSGTPCAMVFGLCRDLPGVPGFVATVARKSSLRTWPQHREDRTTRFCRMHHAALVGRADASIASRPTFHDDREAPLVRAG